MCFNFFITLVPRANLPKELQINKHLAFFISSKIIFIFPSLSALYMNDQRNNYKIRRRNEKENKNTKTRSRRKINFFSSTRHLMHPQAPC
jgi:hypothetical protein